MRRIAILGALGAFLAGCAAYDAGSLPAASQAYHVAIDRCNAALSPTQAFSDGMECIIAADRQFAIAVKLRDMSLFESYATRLRLLSADVEAGRVAGPPVATRYLEIRTDYLQAVEAAQAHSREQAQAWAAAAGAMGESMQREADRQALQNAANRPLNCTSARFGTQVNTTCN